MTDYFALLNQPRLPWLELEDLKQASHEKTLHTHPDARAQGSDSAVAEAAFAQVNEAYQVLRDPKRRLQHLLSLLGETPDDANAQIPREVEELFPAVASLTHQADRLISKAGSASNVLARSLLKSEFVAADASLKALLQQLSALHEAALARLRQVSASWQTAATSRSAELQALYVQFSYLTRWIAELEEKRLRLTSAL